MLGFVDVILRVPPVFIIDEILKISMGLPFNTVTNDPTLDTNQMSIMDGGASDADNILVNGSSSSNFSSLGGISAINSSLEQILNDTTAQLFGAATEAATGAAPIIADDTEFYKILSLTSLRFLSCLLGESRAKFNQHLYNIFFNFTSLPDNVAVVVVVVVAVEVLRVVVIFYYLYLLLSVSLTVRGRWTLYYILVKKINIVLISVLLLLFVQFFLWFCKQNSVDKRLLSVKV